MTTLREDLNIKPEDFYVLFKGDKDLYAQAANILYDWYEAEGSFEDFSSKKKFLDFVEWDIYDMLDAADSKEDVITVEKAMGIYDPEQWEDPEEDDLDEDLDPQEDVETIYKVFSIVYPDIEETEEFNSKEAAMDYGREQISSGNYDEVIVSEITIDEDGYEDETILLDEQGEHEDSKEYEPQLTTDPMNAGQWYESLHEEKDRYSVLREALDRLDREDKIREGLYFRAPERRTVRRYLMANGGKKIQIDLGYSTYPINGGSEGETESVWERLVDKAKDIVEREHIEYYTISKYIEPLYGILRLNLRVFPSQEAKDAWDSGKHGREEIMK